MSARERHIKRLDEAGDAIRYGLLHNYFGATMSPPDVDAILGRLTSIASYLEQYTTRLASGLERSPAEFELYAASDDKQPDELVAQAVRALRSAAQRFDTAMIDLQTAESATTWVGYRSDD